ncbi:class F sortase [Streptomyces sp. NPDC057540]|uniref:class F sortase n=1 Tax=Streptomyces sp. NPDC057540 TaxID=3346160 RepID=UPI0036851840
MTLSVTFASLTGMVSACSSDEESGPRTAVAEAVRSDDAAGGGPSPAALPAAHAPLTRSRPVKVAIPALFVEAPLIPLRLDSRGRLGAPPLDQPMSAGWHQAGPSPGERGTAVLVGHRDTLTGPAVFLSLKALRRGDTVKVTRADRTAAVFTVDDVTTYAKDTFPDRKVYGPTGRAELRLITCGGRFDKKDGYDANVVAFAHLTALHTPKA